MAKTTRPRLKPQRTARISLPQRAGSWASNFIGQSFRGQSREFNQLLSITLALVALGSFLVLDATYVSASKSGDFVLGDFFRNLVFSAGGIFAMGVIARATVPVLLRYKQLLLTLSVGAQIFVLIFGATVNGNKNWIYIPGVGTIQPSEFLKLALVLQIATLLTQRRDRWHDFNYTWGAALITAALAGGLVIAGSDAGTVIVMSLLTVIQLALAGLPKRALTYILIVGAIAAPILANWGASRKARTFAWLHPDAPDPNDVNWQAKHGIWALAAGGFGGTGVGQSKMKWSWIPEVENDFIFAIVGEEFGLIGCAVVILMYVFLAMVLINILRKTDDLWSRIVVGGVAGWIVVQAMINIAVVLSLLPVLGVPLPLLSKGGSSMVANLMAIGVVLAIERANGRRFHPAKIKATATRKPQR